MSKDFEKPFTAKKLFKKKIKEKPRAVPSEVEIAQEEEDSKVQVGSLIEHETYGVGVVLRYKNPNTIACDFQGSQRDIPTSMIITLLTAKEVEETVIASGLVDDLPISDPKPDVVPEDDNGKD